MPTEVCSQVLPERSIHSLPHRRGGAVLGLANVEGALVPCLSLAVILGLAPAATAASPAAARGGAAQTPGSFPRLLVIAAPAGRLALPIAETLGLCRFREQDLQAIPAGGTQGGAAYTRAVLPLADRAVGLLDAGNLLRAMGEQLA
jgi:chemotaxis-related protein WspD